MPPDLTIVRFADRPDLEGGMWDLTDQWPAYMLEDPIADLFFSRMAEHPDTVLLAIDADEQVVARAFAVPFAMGAGIGRPELPAQGWDGVIRWEWLDSLVGREPTHLSMLEVTVAPSHRAAGVPQMMLEAMKDVARRRSLEALVAPVRPSRKQHEPETPMDEYALRTGDDGLPFDPWLRLHVRLGAEIVAVAPRSMTISGTLDEWRAWTGEPFDTAGPTVVPGALTPVHVDLAQDHAVYVEPNVWVAHPL